MPLLPPTQVPRIKMFVMIDELVREELNEEGEVVRMEEKKYCDVEAHLGESFSYMFQLIKQVHRLM